MQTLENSYLQLLEKELAPLQKQLQDHALYHKIKTIADLRLFMEYHVFAVFDFMSLLKALQMHLTTTTLPWIPKANPQIRRFINEIVLAEESDVDASGIPASHYELYVASMQEAGASTRQVDAFIAMLEKGTPVKQAITEIDAPKAVQDFLDFTFSVVYSNAPHQIAAVFAFGREDLIPKMFLELVKGLEKQASTTLDSLVYYLERHIELDGDSHGPLALQMISSLCATDKDKWEQAISLSKQALTQRILLWDAIAAKL